MRRISTMIDWFTFVDIRPELAISQFNELQNQVPLLYALLSVNAVAVAYTHYGFGPSWMTVTIPTLLVSASVVRMFWWLHGTARPITSTEAVRQFRRTLILAALFAVGYISWSLGLSRYGGTHEQAHVAIFIAITVIGCLFCLISLPQAAITVSLIVIVPSALYYVSLGDNVYEAVGINIFLVGLVMIYILFNSYRSFARLVQSTIDTERLSREATLLAHTDALTRLPNRRCFFSELDAAIDRSLKIKRILSVGIIDLDRFKIINDAQGHLFGDQLLESVGDRLREIFPRQGLVSRVGGDEFAFYIELDGTAATNLANKICEILSAPYKIGASMVSVGASCGVATLSSVNADVGSAYGAADYALYIAKSERRGSATLYSAKHEAHIRSEQTIEIALQGADLPSEMDLHYQPIVGESGFTIIAVEALARWTSPALGVIRPDVFIPLAERSGIVHRLTQTLFKKALCMAERLSADIKMSFNLSAHDLTNPETILSLVALIRDSNIPPGRIIFELTETAVMRDFTVAEESIVLLRALGVQIALDDFGTGHSSLSYLRRLPIDKVKIDRSFISGVNSQAGYDLLAAIVAMCEKMKMSCIAEGVESSEQLKALIDIGCASFQGYLFSKPLSGSDLVDFLKQKQVA